MTERTKASDESLAEYLNAEIEQASKLQHGLAMDTNIAAPSSKWATPAEVTDLDVAFGPARMGDLLPAYYEVPDEFRNHNARGIEWNNVASHWFCFGLKGKLVPKPGIEKQAALRHLAAVMGSYQPKHEHKIAGVAYLMSLWFEPYEPVPEEAKGFR